MKSSEIELVKKVQTGNEAAFEELYQVYYGRAFSLAFQMTNDAADAQDVVQEAFIQVHKSIHGLQNPEYFYSWLHRILHSKSIDLFHRNRHQDTVDPVKMEKYVTYEEKRRYMLPADESDYLNERELLRKLISEMDQKYSEILMLAYFDQMKLEEIAQLLDLPIGTVKTRSRRAKADLKKRIHTFEEAEQRKLSFNVDAVLPSIIVYSFASIGHWIKQHCANLFSGNAIHAACAASVVTLTISGANMVVQDYRERQNYVPQSPTNADLNQEKKAENQIIPNEVMKTQEFGPYFFQDQRINTTREAYFVCINWASTLDDRKQMPEDEMNEMQAIYEALKQRNDQFYQMLAERRWESDFLEIVSK